MRETCGEKTTTRQQSTSNKKCTTDQEGAAGEDRLRRMYCAGQSPLSQSCIRNQWPWTENSVVSHLSSAGAADQVPGQEETEVGLEAGCGHNVLILAEEPPLPLEPLHQRVVGRVPAGQAGGIATYCASAYPVHLKSMLFIAIFNPTLKTNLNQQAQLRSIDPTSRPASCLTVWPPV